VALNLPFSGWESAFPDGRLAAAVVDRLTYCWNCLRNGHARMVLASRYDEMAWLAGLSHQEHIGTFTTSTFVDPTPDCRRLAHARSLCRSSAASRIGASALGHGQLPTTGRKGYRAYLSYRSTEASADRLSNRLRRPGL
jgi:hypothetical protein